MDGFSGRRFAPGCCLRLRLIVRQDALSRVRDLAEAIHTARGRWPRPPHDFLGAVAEYPRNPLAMRDSADLAEQTVWRQAFPDGPCPSRVPFWQLEQVRAGVPCRSSSSLVVARPRRSRAKARAATMVRGAALPAKDYSAFEGSLTASPALL